MRQIEISSGNNLQLKTLKNSFCPKRGKKLFCLRNLNFRASLGILFEEILIF